MSEFRSGIFNVLQKLLGGSSFSLAVIYTLGHICIAMTCNMIITGAALDLALMDAVVEPLINGVWFYVLHNAWKRFNKQ